jgi:hypothetical protein
MVPGVPDSGVDAKDSNINSAISVLLHGVGITIGGGLDNACTLFGVPSIKLVADGLDV